MKTQNQTQFTPETTKVLFAVRKGNEDWQEELITEQPDKIANASEWAKQNGFDRLRIAEINLSISTDDFAKAVKI